MRTLVVFSVLALVGLVALGLSLLLRRRIGDRRLHPEGWSAVLGFVAATYGIFLGFSIVLLFGQVSNARQATGDEATSIGTAFEEIRLFPNGAPAVQHALLCYARAVSEVEWDALADGRSAAEADVAYRDVILALGDVEDPVDRTFQPAAATNIFVQVGSISTARETRIVAAQTRVHVLFWTLVIGGGAVVLALLFILTMAARPLEQAAAMAVASVFSATLIILVWVLAQPFSAVPGALTPRQIDDTIALMSAEAPEAAARPCRFDPAG